jgi:hypothetical protein
MDSIPKIRIKRILNDYGHMYVQYVNENDTVKNEKVRIKTDKDEFTINICLSKDTIIPAHYSYSKTKNGRYLELNPIFHFCRLFKIYPK